MHQIIIFASGKGSNTSAIIQYFKEHKIAEIALVVTNNATAGVLSLAAMAGIPTLVVDKKSFTSPELIVQLQKHNPSLIVLAGFLWKIPAPFVAAFNGKIINIHPALLPAHGGKGMYGHHVHNAVLACGEVESGITIHQVNEVYDDGGTLLQARCPVMKEDTADTLAGRIHKLEHFYLPRVIHFMLQSS